MLDAGEPREVAIVGHDVGAVLEREGHEMGVGRQIAGCAGVPQEPAQQTGAAGWAARQPPRALRAMSRSHPHLAPVGIAGNPDETTDAELTAASRRVLDELYAQELSDLRAQYAQRVPQGRASDDLAAIARAATFGAVDTVFVDIDETLPGSVDDADGALTLDETDDAINYGVVDEIARRVLLARGRVLAVRRGDIPGGGPAAAILRYPNLICLRSARRLFRCATASASDRDLTTTTAAAFGRRACVPPR
jgi:hypothetical protein